MARLHEQLYQSKNLKEIDIKHHFTVLVEEIIKDYQIDKEISLDINIGEATLGIKTLVPLGLIINELISNSLKYAFKGKKEGEIIVHLNPDYSGRAVTGEMAEITDILMLTPRLDAQTARTKATAALDGSAEAIAHELLILPGNEREPARLVYLVELRKDFLRKYAFIDAQNGELIRLVEGSPTH